MITEEYGKGIIMGLFSVFADVNVTGFFLHLGLVAVAAIAVIVIAAVFITRALRQRRQFGEFPGEDTRDDE